MMRSSSQRKKTLLYVSLYIVIVVITRLPSFLEPILNIDEADFAVQTAVWMNGGIPYVDFVEKKPPLIHMAYRLAFEIGSVWNMQAVHLLFTGIVILTGILLMMTAGRIGGPRAGIHALILFSAYQAGYDLNDFLAANTETLMNLFCVAAILFAILAISKAKRTWNIMLAGAMAGIACLAKPVAISILPAIGIGILMARPKIGALSIIVRDFALLLIGFSTPLMICALYLHGEGALADAIRWLWMENVSYSASTGTFGDCIASGITRVGIYMAVSSPLWILASGYSLKQIRKGRFSSCEAVLSSWILFSFVTVSLGGRFFPHYFLQFLPPLTILAALGWKGWLQPIAKKRQRLSTLLTAIAIAVPIAGFMILHLIEVKNLQTKAETERKIGSFISRSTPPDSRIFVWGHNSDIYFYSKRLPASRFAYCSYLTHASEGLEDKNRISEVDEDAWRMLMDDLAETKPALVVDMSGTGIRGYDVYPIEKFSALHSFLTFNYSQSAEISMAKIWRKN